MGCEPPRALLRLGLPLAAKKSWPALAIKGIEGHLSPVTVLLPGAGPGIDRGRTMAKLKLIAVILAASIMSVAAYGQDNGGGLVAPELSKPAPGHLLDQDYLTSTGATVPRPGDSQAAGPTPLDRAIEQQDNKIDNSICKGC